MCYFIERTQKCTKLFFNHYLKENAVRSTNPIMRFTFINFALGCHFYLKRAVYCLYWHTSFHNPFFFSKKVIISGLQKWNHIFLRSFSLLVAAPQSGTRKIQSIVHLVKGEIEYRLCFLYSYILHQWLVGRSQIGIKKAFYINEGGGSLGMS